MRHWLFPPFLAVWTVICGTPAVVFWWAPTRWLEPIQYRWGAGVLVLLRWCCQLKYQVLDPSGALQKTEGPVIFASRHHSAWETIAYLHILSRQDNKGSQRRTLRYILKRELFRIPFFGWYLYRIGMVGLNRNQGVKMLRSLGQRAAACTRQGHSLVVFPEGTRTPQGTPFRLKRGIVAVYEATNLPVIPLTVDAGSYWPKGKNPRGPGTITVTVGEMIPAGLGREEMEERLKQAFA